MQHSPKLAFHCALSLFLSLSIPLLFAPLPAFYSNNVWHSFYLLRKGTVLYRTKRLAKMGYSIGQQLLYSTKVTCTFSDVGNFTSRRDFWKYFPVVELKETFFLVPTVNEIRADAFLKYFNYALKKKSHFVIELAPKRTDFFYFFFRKQTGFQGLMCLGNVFARNDLIIQPESEIAFMSKLVRNFLRLRW